MELSQKNKKDKPIDIKEIYTPLSVAKKEIWKHWNDKALKKKVDDFGEDVSKLSKSSVSAV